jgi:hypothetical protein
MAASKLDLLIISYIMSGREYLCRFYTKCLIIIYMLSGNNLYEKNTTGPNIKSVML